MVWLYDAVLWCRYNAFFLCFGPDSLKPGLELWFPLAVFLSIVNYWDKICWLESVNHLFVCVYVWPQEDQGGERVLQKKWTTFLKAQLLCSLPDDGFPFNIIQDVYVLPAQHKTNTLLYAVFTSQWWAKDVERQRKISLMGEDVFN